VTWPVEPVVGWRIWRLVGWRLESWAVDYCWQPGENRAVCLPRNRVACESPPGPHCQCGFWAVWSPRACLARADSDSELCWHVMGLISGWGTVALHGREGFRAERAAIRCLFTDWSPSAYRSAMARGRLHRWVRRRMGASEAQASPTRRDRRRVEALHDVAGRYGVPLVSLLGAVEVGLLSELGVPSAQVEEAAFLGAIFAPGPVDSLPA
jgi:hypothetical protein